MSGFSVSGSNEAGNYVPPKGVLLDSSDAYAAGGGTDTMVSGRIRVYRGHNKLMAGTSLTSISAHSNGASTTPAHQWFCLVNWATHTVLAVTANDLTTAWGANARKTLTIANGPYVAPSTMEIGWGIMQSAATPATIRGQATLQNFTSRFTNTTDAMTYDDTSTGLTTPVSVGTVLVPAISTAGILGYMYAS